MAEPCPDTSVNILGIHMAKHLDTADMNSRREHRSHSLIPRSRGSRSLLTYLDRRATNKHLYRTFCPVLGQNRNPYLDQTTDPSRHRLGRNRSPCLGQTMGSSNRRILHRTIRVLSILLSNPFLHLTSCSSSSIVCIYTYLRVIPTAPRTVKFSNRHYCQRERSLVEPRPR